MENDSNQRKQELARRAMNLRKAQEALSKTPAGHWLRAQREAAYQAARDALWRMGSDGRRVAWGVILG